MTRPTNEGRIIGDMFAPRDTWAALNAARGAKEARAFALLVEAERIMRDTQHPGVASSQVELIGQVGMDIVAEKTRWGQTGSKEEQS